MTKIKTTRRELGKFARAYFLGREKNKRHGEFGEHLFVNWKKNSDSGVTLIWEEI